MICSQQRVNVHAGKERLFIEVKASSRLDKPYFEISLQELQLAQDMEDCFIIYRVLGVGTGHIRVLRLDNVKRALVEGSSRLLCYV